MNNLEFNEKVANAIAELQEKLQEIDGTSELLPRESVDNPIKLPAIASSPNSSSIRVMQWNILAQGFCPYSRFAYCPAATLQYPRRSWMVLWEILRHQADIICLQETDLYQHIMDYMRQHSLPYQGVFQPKMNSACLDYPNNFGADGCAVLYRSDKFQHSTVETIFLGTKESTKYQSQVAVLVELRALPSMAQCLPPSLCVICLHMKASLEFADIRAKQGDIILNRLVGATSSGEEDKVAEVPLLVCGDFNAEPTEPVYDKFLQSTQPTLRSAYRQVLEQGLQEPAFTTWKTRHQGGRFDTVPTAEECTKLIEVCHTIDYIWYSANLLHPQRVLDIPSKAVIGPDGLPCAAFPSDHMSLVADFVWPAVCDETK